MESLYITSEVCPENSPSVDTVVTFTAAHVRVHASSGGRVALLLRGLHGGCAVLVSLVGGLSDLWFWLFSSRFLSRTDLAP